MQINSARPEVSEQCVEQVAKLLRDGQLASCAVTGEFQEELTHYLNAPNGELYVTPVSSGTAALHLALLALGIGEGDIVIVPAFTFMATVAAIYMVGATPAYVEIEPGTFGISPKALADLLLDPMIKRNAKAILPVHLFGQAVDYGVFEMAREHGLKIVEDACQAIGATIHGEKVGTLGDIGVFSFYATKNMFCGEGGAVVTKDKKIAQSVTELANHGQIEKYYAAKLGYNYRMTNIQAAIGLDSLRMLDRRNAARRVLSYWYKAKLKFHLEKGFITLPECKEGSYRSEQSHVWHQYTIIAHDIVKGHGAMASGKNRDGLLKYLRDNGVGATVNYPTPIHEMVPYRFPPPRFPLGYTEWLCRHVISLPIHPGVTAGEVNYIAEMIEAYYG